MLRPQHHRANALHVSAAFTTTTPLRLNLTLRCRPANPNFDPRLEAQNRNLVAWSSRQ